MDTNNALIKKVIEALLQVGVIKFKRFSNYRGIIDVEVRSDIFTKKVFWIEIYEDDWNSGPTRAFVDELVGLILDGKISLTPLCEEITYRNN